MNALVPTPPARPVVSVSKHTIRDLSTVSRAAQGRSIVVADSAGHDLSTRYTPAWIEVPAGGVNGRPDSALVRRPIIRLSCERRSVGARVDGALDRPACCRSAFSRSVKLTKVAPKPTVPRPSQNVRLPHRLPMRVPRRRDSPRRNRSPLSVP